MNLTVIGMFRLDNYRMPPSASIGLEAYFACLWLTNQKCPLLNLLFVESTNILFIIGMVMFTISWTSLQNGLVAFYFLWVSYFWLCTETSVEIWITLRLRCSEHWLTGLGVLFKGHLLNRENISHFLVLRWNETLALTAFEL